MKRIPLAGWVVCLALASWTWAPAGQSGDEVELGSILPIRPEPWMPTDRQEDLDHWSAAAGASKGILPTAVPAVRFRWPLRMEDWWAVSNYVDLDPDSGILDYTCNAVSYDGHTGIDIIIRNFVEMDEGRPVLAAAPGTVVFTSDGNFDRNTAFNSLPCNFVLIEHPDGTVVQYNHLKKWSTRVYVGQRVAEGQLLGEIGSSCSSTDPHLHFQINNGGARYEPFSGPCQPGPSLWQEQIPHASLMPVQLMDAGLTTVQPTGDLIKRRYPDVRHVQRTSAGATIYAWFRLAAVHKGDRTEIVLRRPDGRARRSPFQHQSFFSYADYYLQVNMPRRGPQGVWTVEYWLNETLQTERRFSYDAAPYQRPVGVPRAAAVTRGVFKDAVGATDADGGIKDIRLARPPDHGEITLHGARNRFFAYVPESGYAGPDSFAFEAENGQGAVSDPAAVCFDVSAHRANVLRLEGEGDHLAVPENGSLALTGPFTLEAWIRRDKGSAGRQALVDRRGPSITSPHGLSLYLNFDSRVELAVGDGSSVRYAYSTALIPLDRWVYVAATWDGAYLRLFVDDREEPSPQPFRGPLSWAGVVETAIGGTPLAAIDSLRGEIDEVRVWSVPRSGVEIARDATCDFFDQPPPSTLRAWWRLDGDALDSSPNGNHGIRRAGASFVRAVPGFPYACAVQDLDGDALPDGQDNCPLDLNPDQADTDADGAGDACDFCPATPDAGQADTDGDGVGDACDLCPSVGDTRQEDADSDGIGDLCDGTAESGAR